MALIPLGIIWVGYSFVWYGVKLIQGPGIGIIDVISPSRIAKMDGPTASGTSTAPPGTATSSPVNSMPVGSGRGPSAAR